jgi:hypothetical protein
MASNNYLHDINIYARSMAYNDALNSTKLAFLLGNEAANVAILYQARVGRKTGKLRASANPHVRVGGRRNDRVIGVMSIVNDGVFADWKGKDFYYGVYHEEGTLNSRRAKRRTSEARRPRPGYHELREVAQEWRRI